MEYVAFLLGINVGTRSIKMAHLRELVETLGYKNVRTVAASGNVVFEAGNAKAPALVTKLEGALEKRFGFKVGVIVRSMNEIEQIIKRNPFKKVRITEHTRQYVTFMAEKPAHPQAPRRVSHQYEILKVTEGEVFSHLELSPAVKTPDVMKELGNSYGKKITTRNWNTIEKIAAA